LFYHFSVARSRLPYAPENHAHSFSDCAAAAFCSCPPADFNLNLLADRRRRAPFPPPTPAAGTVAINEWSTFDRRQPQRQLRA
jgi:hypothetical protein